MLVTMSYGQWAVVTCVDQNTADAGEESKVWQPFRNKPKDWGILCDALRDPPPFLLYCPFRRALPGSQNALCIVTRGPANGTNVIL